MLTSADISDLLARTAQRDRAAFARLYEATSSKLYGIVLRILKRRDVSDEVLQEVYVKIWERAGDFDAGRASPITWMSTIARNRALDELRRKRPDSIEDHPEALDVAGEDELALDAVLRGEDGRRLSDCLSKLEVGARANGGARLLRGSVARRTRRSATISPSIPSRPGCAGRCCN